MAVVADVVVLDEVNGNAGTDEPKPTEETPDAVDLSPNKNPVDGEEPNTGLDIDDGPRELLPNNPEVAAGETVLPGGMEELALAEKEKTEFEVVEPVVKDNPGVEFDALVTEEKNAELVLDTPVPDGKENPELEPKTFALWLVVSKGTCPNPGEDELFDPNAEDNEVPNTEEEELLNPNVVDEEKEPGSLVKL